MLALSIGWSLSLARQLIILRVATRNAGTADGDEQRTRKRLQSNPPPTGFCAMTLAAKCIFRVLLIIAFSLITGSILRAQDATGTVSGTVVCNDGNAPGRGAKVALIPLDRLVSKKDGSGSKSTSTDFSGIYEFGSVAPGTYVVNASLDGYNDDLKLVLSVLDFAIVEDRKRVFAAFPQVTVKPATIVRKDLVLRRAAAISGRATVDTGGVPGRSAVIATRIPGIGQADSLISRSEGSELFTQSSPIDDRGDFRIAGLPAGKYRISLRVTEAYFRVEVDKGSIRPQPERTGTAELNVYAPEALDEAHARVIEVNDGDEITDADITVPTRLLHSVAGIVTEGGAPVAGISITLERERDGASIGASDALSMADGSYRFDLLPPGNYTVRAKHRSAGLTGERPVQVQDSDVIDANIDLRGAATQTH